MQKIFYAKALDADPQNSEYAECLGMVYEKMGDIDNAKKYYLKVIEIDAEQILPFTLRIARMLKKAKDYEQAEKYYLKCLEIDDKYKFTNGSYGHMLYLMGDYQNAIKYTKIQLDINDDKSHWYFNYAYFYHLNGNYEEAQEILNKFIERVTTNKIKDRMIKIIENIKDRKVENMIFRQEACNKIRDKFA